MTGLTAGGAVLLMAALMAGQVLAGPAAADATPAPSDSSRTVNQELLLTDGSRLLGRIEREEGEHIWFRTVAGALVALERAHVRSLAPLAESRPASTEQARPAGTRLFFAPTGRSLRRGQATLGVYEVLLPFVQYGLSDRLSLGGGTPLLFGGGIEHPVWLTPKLQLLDRPNLGVAAGVMHILLMGEDDAGVAYAVATAGPAARALTVGAGVLYSEESPKAVLLLGGGYALSPRLTLLSENYATDEFGLVSLGLRFTGGSLSADLGMACPIDSDVFFAFPLVNFVWTVGGGDSE